MVEPPTYLINEIPGSGKRRSLLPRYSTPVASRTDNPSINQHYDTTDYVIPTVVAYAVMSSDNTSSRNSCDGYSSDSGSSSSDSSSSCD